MEFIVCDQWPLEVAEFEVTTNDVSKRPYFYFIEKKMNDLGLEALCYQESLKNVQGVDTAVEFFGGMGMTATIIQNTLKPKIHTLFELNEDCFCHLFELFPKCKVVLGDSYQFIGYYQAQLVCLDFNTFTLKTHYENKDLLNTVFMNRPKFVLLTDSAISKFHLNKKVYSKLVGKELTDFKSYCEGYSFRGYGIRSVFRHNNASYLLFEDGYKGDFEVTNVKEMDKTPLNGFRRKQ